jgi:hypothetical protein
MVLRPRIAARPPREKFEKLKSATAIAPLLRDEPPLQTRKRKRKFALKRKVRGRSVGIGHNGGPPLAPLRERLLAADDDAVLSFREWCALNGFGERTGRRILAAPGGPTVTQLTDKRIGISRRANRARLESRARGGE